MSRSYVKRRAFLACRSRKMHKRLLNKHIKNHNRIVLLKNVIDIDGDYNYNTTRGELDWNLDTFHIFESFTEYRRSYMYIHSYDECDMTEEIERQIRADWKKAYTK